MSTPTNNAARLSLLFVKHLEDNRPYINISIYGCKVHALLDSGARHSFIGKDGLHLIKKFKLRKDSVKAPRAVYTVDGKHQDVNGCYDMPVCLENSCQIINFYVVPSLKYVVVLGSNFCNQFKIIINYQDYSWDIRSDRMKISAVDSTDTRESNMPENTTLTDAQKKFATNVFYCFREIKVSENQIGQSHKLTHHIDTGAAKPFRQNQYFMSPYMLKHLNGELDRMLTLDVIEPSHGAWSSTVLLV